MPEIKTYEIYCEKHSQIIQTELLIDAVDEFMKQNPDEEVIFAESVLHRNKNLPSQPGAAVFVKERIKKRIEELKATESVTRVNSIWETRLLGQIDELKSLLKFIEEQE